jgi:3-hydroxymyristoyl/3-hydroxydecanoyl-(acyl carrier protein) dehydratase
MPGVLIVEAMAQTGGMLLRSEIGEENDRLAVFMGINQAKFRRPVVPGDVLLLELKLIGRKFNTFTLSGMATVDGKPVAQAEISLAIIDRK